MIKTKSTLSLKDPVKQTWVHLPSNFNMQPSLSGLSSKKHHYIERDLKKQIRSLIATPIETVQDAMKILTDLQPLVHRVDGFASLLATVH